MTSDWRMNGSFNSRPFNRTRATCVPFASLGASTVNVLPLPRRNKMRFAPGAWSDVKFPLSKKLEHWDGANDGVVHFPVKSIAVSIPMPADATSGETLFSNFSVR